MPQKFETKDFSLKSVTEPAIYQFNYRLAQYVNIDRFAEMESVREPELIRNWFGEDRIERRISDRLFKHIGGQIVTVDDLNIPHHRLALQSFETIQQVCLCTVARIYAEEIGQLIDGAKIREIIQLLGERHVNLLRVKTEKNRVFRKSTTDLPMAISNQAQNYLAGWLLSLPQAIRSRAILKMPPTTLTSIFVGNSSCLLSSLNRCLKEAENA
ncbi:MAG: SctK family type III secretion system sorting platform protein [Halopseudomonas aestusnigri]